MSQRSILHLDLDAFFVAVEQLHNTALRGRPLIVGGSSARGVVACCSYEARRFGVYAGMPVRLARQRCPEAKVVQGDMERYARHSALVTEILAKSAPVLEKASIDEFYLDLTGMDRYIGCWKWAGELRQRVERESGLPLSMGLAVNKLVAKVGAGEAKPNGARRIAAGQEKRFFAPLPVSRLPAVGPATCHRLAVMGVRTVASLSQIPPELLQREFGRPGLSLWKKANAIDCRPVEPYTDRKSVAAERAFEVDTTDMAFLRSALNDMIATLGYELRASGRLASLVTVKLRYTDHNTFSRQRSVVHTASDDAFRQVAYSLLEQLYQRRQLVRMVGIKLSGLAEGSPQLSLFGGVAEEQALLKAMDQIRYRFGKGAVQRGA